MTDLRSLLAGGALGVLAATGLWVLRAPTSVLPAQTQEPIVDHAPVSSSLPAAAANDVTSSASERRQAESQRSAPDPDFAVIAMGRVLDSEGAVVPGATPIFEDAQALRHSAQAGSAGTWSLTGMHPGPVELSLTVSGYLPVYESLEVPATREWRHDLELVRARRLPVRFETPDGEAIAPVGFGQLESYLGVFASSLPPDSPLPGVQGRVLQHYGESEFLSRAERQTPADLDPRYQGILSLKSAAPAWVSVACRDQVLETRALGELDNELVFVLTDEQIHGASGEVRVRIVERGTGVPIEAHFQIQHPSGGLRIAGSLVDGVQVFEDVPCGELELCFHGDGYEWLQVEVRVPAGGELDLGTIALGKEATFEVHVSDKTGAPQPLRVQAARIELARSPQDLNLSMSSSTNAQGVVQISWLAPGMTLVRCGGRDGFARVARLVDTASTTLVELVVPAGGVEVVFKLGAQAAGAEQFRLEDSAGLALYAGRWMPREVLLVPGDYSLRTFVEGLETDSIVIRVGQERQVVRYGGE